MLVSCSNPYKETSNGRFGKGTVVSLLPLVLNFIAVIQLHLEKHCEDEEVIETTGKQL